MKQIKARTKQEQIKDLFFAIAMAGIFILTVCLLCGFLLSLTAATIEKLEVESTLKNYSEQEKMQMYSDSLEQDAKEKKFFEGLRKKYN